MGAIKENFYTENETNLFYAARAFAHPARVKILTELLTERSYRNTDLSKILRLSTVAIHNHIEMLKDANMIVITYSMHYYEIGLSSKGEKWAELFNSQKQY